MAAYSDTFDWIDFPQGRVRYVGQQRGRDEPPIDVFAVEIYGWTYFGEIRRSYLPDRNHYNLDIVSFGWLKKDWFGTEPDPAFCASFTIEQIEAVQALMCQAVMVWSAMDDRPHILFTKFDFTGDIVFQDGWVLLKSGKDAM